MDPTDAMDPWPVFDTFKEPMGMMGTGFDNELYFSPNFGKQDELLPPWEGPTLPTLPPSPLPSGMLKDCNGDDRMKNFYTNDDDESVTWMPTATVKPSAPQRTVAKQPPLPRSSLSEPAVRDGDVLIYVVAHADISIPDTAARFNLQTTPLSTLVRKMKGAPAPEEAQKWSEFVSSLHAVFRDYAATAQAYVDTVRANSDGVEPSVVIYSRSPMLTAAFLVPMLMHTRTAEEATAFVRPLISAIGSTAVVDATMTERLLRATEVMRHMHRCSLRREQFGCIVSGCNNCAKSGVVPFCANHVKPCSRCGKNTVYPWHAYSLKNAAPVLHHMCAACSLLN